MPSEGSSSTERTGVSNLHCIHCLFSCLWCLVAGPAEGDWELHCQQLWQNADLPSVCFIFGNWIKSQSSCIISSVWAKFDLRIIL